MVEIGITDNVNGGDSSDTDIGRSHNKNCGLDDNMVIKGIGMVMKIMMVVITIINMIMMSMVTTMTNIVIVMMTATK